MAALAGMVWILVAAGAGSSPQAWQPATMAPAHSHNDYEQPHPLADALALGFPSVEADVVWSGHDVAVSHDVGRSRGRLADLYLDPLQRRVSLLGSVYGDGRPFYLWIDLKEGRDELVAALRALLAGYPMLTTVDEAGGAASPVTVILTGDEGAKARLLEGAAAPRAFRDSNSFRPDDPPSDGRWTWYALTWGDALGWWTALWWDGAGPVPSTRR